MGLDIAKLEKVSRKPNGKIIARCPACAVEGNDAKGEHLAVFPDGRFGCVVNPQDKAHTKEIYKLVGLRGVETPTRPFDVQRALVPPSAPIMDLGRFSIDRLKIDPPALPDTPLSVEPPKAPPPVEILKAGTPIQSPRKPRERRKTGAIIYWCDDPITKAYDEMMNRSGRCSTIEEFLAA